MIVCRQLYEAVLGKIQPVLGDMVKEFFDVRGSVSGEPTVMNRRMIAVKESEWVLQDLKKSSFPEAVEDFRRNEKAGPADGGGIAAPPSSQSEPSGAGDSPERPPWLSSPRREQIPSPCSPSSPTESTCSTRSTSPPKRPRDDSDEWKDMTVSPKKRKCREKC